MISTDGSKPSVGYKTSYDREFDFCRELIALFVEKKGYFDYEEFYDFFNGPAQSDREVIALAEKCSFDISQLGHSISLIYSQLVSFYIKDRDGKNRYDGDPTMTGDYFEGYTGILNSLKELGKSHIVNVHTLNHDLFFERLGNTTWLNGDLSDGFSEMGSPYYGKLIVDGVSYRARLKRFTDSYDKTFRLFKLHGSFDYGIYHTGNLQGNQFRPESYVKNIWRIGFSDLLKEVTNHIGHVVYERCWINYHSDFLTGTTSKILRYGEDLLYKTLFNHFVENLKTAEKLIIIGYGGRDTEINKMLLANFDYATKPVFIVDPYPGDAVRDLASKMNGKIITTELERISVTELQIG